MKKFVPFIIICFALIGASKSRAQVAITIDPIFGSGGKTEINIGGFGNEITAFDASKGNPTTVCGKISTAVSGIYRLGIVRVDTGGKLDPKFGTGGTVIFSSSVTDYPLGMVTPIDTNIILCGVSGLSKAISDEVPTVYFFRKNGTPDSTFGTTGKVAMQFDDQSSGEADNIYFGGFATYVICGTSRAKGNAGQTGFGVMKFKRDGTRDSSYGFGGRAIIPALVHSVHGFFLGDRNTIMCGVSDTGKHELLLARFNGLGMPDSTVGTNGLIQTGIFLNETDTIMAAADHSDTLFILLPPTDASPTLLTLCRFEEHGIPDTINYGDHGFGRSLISPSIQPKGFIILNDKSAIVSGITKGEIGHSIIAFFNDMTGRTDPIFFSGGVAEIDVDNGSFKNYLKYIARVGKADTSGKIKKLIGVGGSIHNGVEYFMIARFITTAANSVPQKAVINDASIIIYPDPVTSSFRVQILSDDVKNIMIVDALGRDILHLGTQDYSPDTKTFSANASNLPNGIYYCIAQIGAQKLARKFVVSH